MRDANHDQAELREVVLHGELARRYGKVHRLSVASAAEAVKALCKQHKGLQQELMNAEDRGVGYQVWVNGHNVDDKELQFQSKGRIYISPVIMGSKKAGTLQVILGIVLIVVGIILTPAYGAGVPLIIAGAGMLASGLYMMLAPMPDRGSDKNEVKSSYFNGAQNTIAQGNPVPVWYGKGIVGGAIISAGITIDDFTLSGGGGGGGVDNQDGGHQWKPNLSLS